MFTFQSLFWLVQLCVFGLIVGAIARFIMPGRDAMGWLATMVLGVAGSVLGGLFGNLAFGRPTGHFNPGWITSVLGALLVLFIYNRFKNKIV